MTDYSKLKGLAECAVGITDISVAPDVVVDLIAEIERIKARLYACRDCAGQGEVYSGHDSYQGHFQPPEPDMDVCGTCGGDGVLGPVEDFESLATERDQLKAENEALRKALTDCSDSLHGEMLQKFGGQPPDDMHPVTRRDYDRDMAEVAGYRAVIGSSP